MSTQAQQEIKDLLSKFDEDFFTFLHQYDLAYGKGDVEMKSDDLHDYIKNVKDVLTFLE